MGCKHGKLILGENDLQDIGTTSGMDPTEIRQKFDDFVEVYPNGKISKKHFKRLISESMPMSEALPKNKDKMEKLTNHIFRVYDSNSDGYIDFVEFMVVYHVMAEGSIEDIYGKIFRLFDVDGDGTITIQEMQRLVKDLYVLIRTTPDEITMGVFKEMDTNEDKKISKEEFIAACLANRGFTRHITSKVVDIFNDIYTEKEDIFNDMYTEKEDIFNDIYTEKEDIFNDIYTEKEDIFNDIYTEKKDIFNDIYTEKEGICNDMYTENEDLVIQFKVV